MELEFLLIGNGLTGKIKKHHYTGQKFNLKNITVEPANPTPFNNLVEEFSVILHLYNNETYAIGLAESSDSLQIESLIDKTKIKPIPKALL
ncbi:hypothetical protein [Atlantibacter hermannii]|uniref:hypothetical protein n=1 Tax=Atlantibacter hermannii TaxID=565 RepID=UPI0022B7C5FE|nr:hypothetical protein [Atlantibacter hermannii]MCZ7836158.1 hypothetical protein [Atlantibacter hermannii]